MLFSWLFSENSQNNDEDCVKKDIKQSDQEQNIEWIKLIPPKYEFLHRGDHIAVIRESDNNVWLIQDGEVYHCELLADELPILRKNPWASDIDNPSWIASAIINGERQYQFFSKEKSCRLHKLNAFAAQYFINLYATHKQHSCENKHCYGEEHCCAAQGCVNESCCAELNNQVEEDDIIL
jgi:hypothetical protein